MPLCKTKIDETTVEDLAELSEIQNHNLGQVCAPSVNCLGIFLSRLFYCYEQCEAPAAVEESIDVFL